MRLFFCWLVILTLSLNSALLAAKPITLKTLDGQSIPFDSLRGKWIFINYWASWCEGCVHEINALNQFNAANTQRIALFAVNYEELAQQELAALVKQFKLTYPSLTEDPGEALQLGTIEVLPVTFVFNPKGQLHTTLYGEVTAKRLSRYL